MKEFGWIAILSFLLPGCADLNELLGRPIDVPPEFNQPVYLRVSDDYVMFQLVTDIAGRDLRLEAGSILTANRNLHQPLGDTLRNACK